MTKVNLKITGYEDSEDKSRTRFNTDKGWMSAFSNEGETLVNDLKDHANRLISVDISNSKMLKKDGSPYVNIRKFFGAVVEQEGIVVEAPKPVETETIESVATRTPMGVKGVDKGTSYYTAYAKDVFIALLEGDNRLSKDIQLSLMKDAIDLVKQARDAFS